MRPDRVVTEQDQGHPRFLWLARYGYRMVMTEPAITPEPYAGGPADAEVAGGDPTGSGVLGHLSYDIVLSYVHAGPKGNVLRGSVQEREWVARYAVLVHCSDLGWHSPGLNDLLIESFTVRDDGATLYRLNADDGTLSATVLVPRPYEGATIEVTLVKVREEDAWADDGFRWDG